MEVKALQQMLVAVPASAGEARKADRRDRRRSLGRRRHGHREDERPEAAHRRAHRAGRFQEQRSGNAAGAVLAAVNEATRRVDEELSKQVKDITGGLPGMMGMKIPGLF